MTSRGRIVVVEDDGSIAEVVRMYLERDGFAVTTAADAATGLAAARQPDTILAVVDLGLPGGADGLELCRRLRAGGGDLPIVILTARHDEGDRVVGLELGADDYVTKPFSPRELVARVRAVLRRSRRPAAPATALRVGDLTLDPRRREVRVGGRPVDLTPREWELLAFLVRNAGLVVSRAQILDGAWGPGWYGDERTVDVHVRQLRAKLGDGLPLATLRGVGYRLG